MNALASDVQEVRQIPGRELSWINAALEQWGAWIWENRDYEGYPSCDAITAFIHGAGGGKPGSRILCRDMPKAVTFTHVIYMMLPDHEAAVIFAEYVPGVSENGQFWSRPEKCAALRLNDDTYRKRLYRAKLRIWEWSCKRRN